MNWNKCLFLWSVRKLEIVYIAQYIHPSMTPPCTPPLNMVFTIFLWRCWTWTSVFCWRCREKTVYINSLTTLSTSILFHVHLNMDFDDLSLEVLDMNQCIFHGGVGWNLDFDDSLNILCTPPPLWQSFFGGAEHESAYFHGGVGKILTLTTLWRPFEQKFKFSSSFCQRPYHIEYTSSRPITEVKQCWA